MIEMQAVKSSSVKKIGFDVSELKPRNSQEVGIVAIEYMNGGTYHYSPVPKSVFETIQASKSIGQSVHILLKLEVGKKYTCKKVS